MSQILGKITNILNDLHTGPSFPDNVKISNASQVVEVFLNTDDQSGAEKKSEAGDGTLGFGFDMKELEFCQELTNATCSVEYYRPLLYAYKSVAPFIIFVGKVLRRVMGYFLVPVFGDQNKFNSAATASINALVNNSRVSLSFMEYTQPRLESMEQMQSRIEALEEALSDLPGSAGRPEPISCHEADGLIDSADDMAWKGRVDSPDELVKHFEGRENVLGFRCGTGTFLEKLKASEVNAVGVDRSAEFTDYCKLKGLSVVQAEPGRYLERQGEESLDGIFTDKLIEHIIIERLPSFFGSAYRALKPGAPLVARTIDPAAAHIYLNAEGIDIGRLKPAHPKAIEHLLCDIGFRQVDLYQCRVETGDESSIGHDLEQVADPVRLLRKMSDSLYKYRNYVIVARK
ncbi:hypothetical protein C4J81_19285 (plasmid) [Deltaproteobacteria bacterium Smac51]|nr:hypothetical protein C4J81_19285 [Deltaproteobacteria bacterium Smac51]